MAGKGSGKGGTGKGAMTPTRASAIQSRAMKTAGTVQAGSFPARAQRAAAINVNNGVVSANSSKK